MRRHPAPAGVTILRLQRVAGAVDAWMGWRAAEGGRRAPHTWHKLLASSRYVKLKTFVVLFGEVASGRVSPDGEPEKKGRRVMMEATHHFARW